MRKFFVLVAVILMAVILIGCGKNEGKQALLTGITEPEPAVNNPIVIPDPGDVKKPIVTPEPDPIENKNIVVSLDVVGYANAYISQTSFYVGKKYESLTLTFIPNSTVAVESIEITIPAVWITSPQWSDPIKDEYVAAYVCYRSPREIKEIRAGLIVQDNIVKITGIQKGVMVNGSNVTVKFYYKNFTVPLVTDTLIFYIRTTGYSG
ncbi:MAG: hypothetical protein WC976_07060 [Caldisericia bacterium]